MHCERVYTNRLLFTAQMKIIELISLRAFYIIRASYLFVCTLIHCYCLENINRFRRMCVCVCVCENNENVY